jgi:L-lactate dehydrogenase complex protein LldG
MYEQFKARAEGVSAEVYRFTTRNEACAHLVGFLKAEGMSDAPGSTALWAEGTFLEGLDNVWLRKVPGISFEVTQDRAANARFGISQMDWALVDTGSLAGDSTAIEQRLVSSLSTIHIALVPTRGLLPDMPALLARVNPRECPYISLITGPSRTADIERVLTIGVHGPERLVIMFVDEMGVNTHGN